MTTPKTLVDFFRNVEKLNKPDLLLAKKGGQWVPMSSGELAGRVKALAAGLHKLAVSPGACVALLSENRPEWPLVDFACQCYGATLVPIFPTMMADQAEYLLKDSGAVVAFASSGVQARKLLEARPRCPALKHVYVMDDEHVPGARPFAELLQDGEKAHEADPAAFERWADARKPEDLATLIYTSGTTGEPKGAMLTQSNFVSNVLASMELLPFDGNGVALSFLPLSHVFERMIEYTYFYRGASIAYAESIEKVRDNFLEVNPHVFAAVPRVYEKVYGRIHEKVEKGSPAARKLFEKALAVGKEVLDLRAERKTPGALLALQHFVFEALVYRKIRAALGTRFKYAVSGGAPLAKDLAEFFWSVGVEIYEGYGLTETSPVITVNGPGAWRLGSVGRAIPGVELKIAGDGEILSRGPHIMRGYLNKPEATREAIDAEGWFHTGDIGDLDADGFLRITDRKKELIVNSNGKNIAPAPIESFLKSDPFVSQPILIGDRRKFLSLLIVPNFEKLKEWAAGNGLGGKPMEQLITEPRVRELYQKSVDRWNQGKPHEQLINRFTILPNDMTIEGGELTPTLKLKRRVIAEKYGPAIDAMYVE